MGGKVTGTIEFGHTDDFDYWAITVSAGDTIFADVDANEFGADVDPGLTLYDSDGITVLAGDGVFDGLDPQLVYVAPRTGRYFLRISAGYGGPGPKPYTINFFQVKCPVTSGDVEPNDSPATATPVALGARVEGKICPSEEGATGNIDYYRFEAHAGTKLEIQVDTVGRERPPFGCACEIVAWIRLLASDGTTELARTYEHSSPPRVQYDVTTTGTYYVAVNMWPGGLRYGYFLRIRAMDAKAPGDPAIVRAEGLGDPWGLVADPSGDFIVSDPVGGRVWWVTTAGKKEVITSAVSLAGGLGWDAFGNLLIAGRNAVYKLAPSGEVSQFIAESDIQWMAVAPDGTLWLTDVTPYALRHYDPLGKPLETIDISAIGPGWPSQVAVTHAGEVYFSTYVPSGEGGASAIWRLAGNQPHKVLEHMPTIWGFTLDIDGNIYVSSSHDGRIYLYDRSGNALAEPFAGGLNGPTGIAFGRDNKGAMNKRLFVLERGSGKLLELNPGGVRARGTDIGYATSAEVIADLLKSGGVLNDTERRFLDAIGNKNGRYDVGDLRAFLIFSAALPKEEP